MLINFRVKFQKFKFEKANKNVDALYYMRTYTHWKEISNVVQGSDFKITVPNNHMQISLKITII